MAAFIQRASATVSDGSSGIIATFGGKVAAGNSVIACLSTPRDNTENWAGMAPTLENGGTSQTLTLIISKSNVASLMDTVMFYLYNANANNVEVNFITTGGGRVNLDAFEVSGLINDVPEGNATNEGTLNATVTTTTVDPTSTSNLEVAIDGWATNDYSSGPTDGFTRLTSPPGGTGAYQEVAYKFRDGDGSALGTGWTLAAGISWVTIIAAFGATAPADHPTMRRWGGIPGMGKGQSLGRSW